MEILPNQPCLLELTPLSFKGNGLLVDVGITGKGTNLYFKMDSSADCELCWISAQH